MSLTSKQFSYLQEMAIPLWRRRDTENSIENNNIPSKTLLISTEDIVNSAFVSDVLSIFGWNLADVTLSSQGIACADFNWYFSDIEHIEFEKHRLITPSLAALCNSTKFKQQLWLCISKRISDKC